MCLCCENLPSFYNENNSPSLARPTVNGAIAGDTGTLFVKICIMLKPPDFVFSFAFSINDFQLLFSTKCKVPYEMITSYDLSKTKVLKSCTCVVKSNLRASNNLSTFWIADSEISTAWTLNPFSVRKSEFFPSPQPTL